jgi:hypothetical protein
MSVGMAVAYVSITNLPTLCPASGSTRLTLAYSESGEMPPASGSGSYIDTSSVTPGASLPLVPAIRISIPSPSTNVACAVLPVMRIATERPLQHTRNDKLCQWGGSRGSIPSISLFRSSVVVHVLVVLVRPDHVANVPLTIRL